MQQEEEAREVSPNPVAPRAAEEGQNEHRDEQDLDGGHDATLASDDTSDYSGVTRAFETVLPHWSGETGGEFLEACVRIREEWTQTMGPPSEWVTWHFVARLAICESAWGGISA